MKWINPPLLIEEIIEKSILSSRAGNENNNSPFEGNETRYPI